MEGQRYLHALGVTGWQEAIVGDYATVPDCFDAFLEAERRGLLTARVVGALWWQRGSGTGQLDGLVERRDRAGQGRFRATSVKIMQDGVCENFTASMLAPYLDGHGHETAGAGASFFDPRELTAAVTAIDAHGFQVHFHAIGDRAVREALDAVAAARAANGPGSGRHHISHLQVVHPDDVPRFRELSVVANCQPLWACYEPQMTELTLPFLGPERAGVAVPVRQPGPVGRTAVLRQRLAGVEPEPAVGDPHRGEPDRPARLPVRRRRGGRAVPARGADRPGHRAGGVHHRLGVREPPASTRPARSRPASWPTWWCWTGTCSPGPLTRSRSPRST